MPIQFNGEFVELFQQKTLLSLLKEYSIDETTPGIAIALNDRIVLRPEWPGVAIKESDRIEVVHAVQGG